MIHWRDRVVHTCLHGLPLISPKINSSVPRNIGTIGAMLFFVCSSSVVHINFYSINLIDRFSNTQISPKQPLNFLLYINFVINIMATILSVFCYVFGIYFLKKFPRICKLQPMILMSSSCEGKSTKRQMDKFSILAQRRALVAFPHHFNPL